LSFLKLPVDSVFDKKSREFFQNPLRVSSSFGTFSEFWRVHLRAVVRRVYNQHS